MTPADDRLDELLVRYWDNALTDAQAAELSARLTTDPAARDRFREFCLEAVAVTERQAVAREAARRPGGWTRRRVLRFVGGGLAAGAAGVLLGRQFLPDPVPGIDPDPVLLTSARGEVSVRLGGPQPARAGGVVPTGGTVSTFGVGSSAVLTYPDGTAVALAGDTVATVAAGRRLILHRGDATADVRPPTADRPPLALSTARATMTSPGGATMTLGQAVRATEVGVHQGRVEVAAPTGEPLAVVQGGELLTLRDDGRRVRPIPAVPDQFAWDLSAPLPEGWHVGYREETADGPVVRPEVWFDPYHQMQMCQIRSDHQYARAFFRLHRDSVVRVRYRVDRPGPAQVVLCVRTGRLHPAQTGVVECNTAFTPAQPGQWQVLEVRAGDMLDNQEAPRFDAPWFGFLVIVNTYRPDLNLRVAEFRVLPPGGAGGVG